MSESSSLLQEPKETLSDLVPLFYGNDINDLEKREDIEITYQDYLLLRAKDLERQKRKIRKELLCLVFKTLLYFVYCFGFVFVFIVFYMGKDLVDNSRCLFNFQCLSRNCRYDSFINYHCSSVN